MSWKGTDRYIFRHELLSDEVEMRETRRGAGNDLRQQAGRGSQHYDAGSLRKVQDLAMTTRNGEGTCWKGASWSGSPSEQDARRCCGR